MTEDDTPPPKKPCGELPEPPWSEDDDSNARKRKPKPKTISRRRNPKRKKENADG
jgi:hypothetical protein